jgi:hypothetical protein
MQSCGLLFYATVVRRLRQIDNDTADVPLLDFCHDTADVPLFDFCPKRGFLILPANTYNAHLKGVRLNYSLVLQK